MPCKVMSRRMTRIHCLVKMLTIADDAFLCGELLGRIAQEEDGVPAAVERHDASWQKR